MRPSCLRPGVYAAKTVCLPPVALVDPKEMGFAIQLLQVGLRMKATTNGPEIWGTEVGDDDAAEMMVASMPQALSNRFVARAGWIVPPIRTFTGERLWF